MGSCNNMHKYSSLRLIISLLVIAIVAIKLSEAYHNPIRTEFQLIHRDHLPVQQQLDRFERIRQMLYRDAVRVERIGRMASSHYHGKQHLEDVGATIGRRLQKIATTTADAESPLISGSDYGSGEYFVKLVVGTPRKKTLWLVADTGSDLTWVDCKYKGNGLKAPAVVFDANMSKSFKTIPCSSSYCRDDLGYLFSVPCKKENNSPCPYNYSYHEGGSAVQGIFANETLTFKLTNGQDTTLKNTLIGCTTSRQGLDSFTAGANGIMGLGNSPFSLPMQASKLFGNMFSYCLVGMFSHKTKSSKLIFGRSQENPKFLDQMQSTELELKEAAPFYGVHIKNISITGGKWNPLNIPAPTWDFKDGGGGAIIDSGTTLAYLAESAYLPVMDALTKPLKKFTKAEGPLEHCYMSKAFNRKSAVAMEIGFVGGAKLAVPSSSYLILVPDESGDANKEVTCLGMMNAGEGGQSIIGNLWQQNHLWEFDIGNGKLNFAASKDCAY